jgi:pimeloyl-ACP methyl ester carboxylesterase
MAAAMARLLRAQSHEVHTPTMTGLAEREHLMSPAIDLDMQITDIVKLLHFEDLRDVILVGHSYGGMVITGVADRATDRIGHRVYLDAAYPTNGESLVDHAGPMMLMARQMGQVIDGIELVLLPSPQAPMFYGVTDPIDIAWMAPKLTAHPWACFEQKLWLANEDAMRALPESHIICTSTIPGRDMDLLRARSNGRVWDIDTGHDLMITEPEWVTERLIEVAGA